MSAPTPSGGGDGGPPPLPPLPSGVETHAAAPATATATASPGEATRGAAKPSKKRPFARFVSWLNCCDATDKGDAIEMDGPRVPSKKPNVVSSMGGRKVVVTEKAGGSAAEGRTTEPKDDDVDVVNKPARDSDKTEVGTDASQPGQPIEAAPPPVRVGMADEAGSDVAVVPSTRPSPPPLSSSSRTDEMAERDRPQERLSPARTDPTPNQHHDDGIPREGPATRAPELKVVIQAPTPVVPHAGELPTPIEPATFATAPPVDEGDLEMPDALPARSTDEPPKEPIPELEMDDKADLPGPPPLEERRLTTQPNRAEHEPLHDLHSLADQHQWLLPPQATRFQRRKCLVLDLDETLVHSSFKVCTCTPLVSQGRR